MLVTHVSSQNLPENLPLGLLLLQNMYLEPPYNWRSKIYFDCKKLCFHFENHDCNIYENVLLPQPLQGPQNLGLEVDSWSNGVVK